MDNKRICLVTRDIIGPVKNGGIGTAFHHLARLLSEAGHRVTVLYTLPDYTESASLGHWVAQYKEWGIELVPLPAYTNLHFRNSKPVRDAYLVYLWLKEHAFDIVHFHDWYGLGYYAMLGKRQGFAFAETTLCVQLHAQIVWHAVHNASPISQFELLEADFMERRSVELADVVISPSRYMVEWTKQRGWNVPAEPVILQNVIPEEEGADSSHSVGSAHIKEVVFFGRLEWRKGLDIFCTALLRLPDAALQNMLITFLGKEGRIANSGARDYIAGRLKERPACRFRILDTLDSREAQAHLQGSGRLAVIASRVENSPYAVLECLNARIPFLATNSGGTVELVAEEDRERVLFAPRADALAHCLGAAIFRGIKPATPADSPQWTRMEWLRLHANLAAKPDNAPGGNPLITVCVTHHNRPELLKRALHSLEKQTYSPFEVIVADDGSDHPDAAMYLETLERDLPARGWQLVRQENLYVGAARNAAAAKAKGEYLMFMDDDNIALPNELEIFARSARRTGADILTCVAEYMPGKHADAAHSEAPATSGTRALFVPLGGCASAGLYENGFGDANMLVRKSTFDAVGGFTEDYGVGLEDMEFFARALLHGATLEMVPEPLFYYREHPGGVQHSNNRILGMSRALRPYLEKFPEIISGLLLAQGYHLALPEIHTDYAGLAQSFSELQHANAELHLANAELKTSNDELRVSNDLLRKFRDEANLRTHLSGAVSATVVKPARVLRHRLRGKKEED